MTGKTGNREWRRDFSGAFGFPPGPSPRHRAHTIQPQPRAPARAHRHLPRRPRPHRNRSARLPRPHRNLSISHRPAADQPTSSTASTCPGSHAPSRTRAAPAVTDRTSHLPGRCHHLDQHPSRESGCCNFPGVPDRMCLVISSSLENSSSPAPSQEPGARVGESPRLLPPIPSLPLKLVLHPGFLSQEGWCTRSTANLSDHIRLLL